MPELPEVETVRRGLEPLVTGRRIEDVLVMHERAVRRQPQGSAEFAAALLGATVADVARRGKYLWWEFADRPTALVAHLGMSGQFRLTPAGQPVGLGPHERARFLLSDGNRISFVDQRTFGWLLSDTMAAGVPRAVSHIALDPFDPAFDVDLAAARLRRRRTPIKRALLDQTVVSGIGNIYADEALWRARMHPETATDSLSAARAREVLTAASDVMAEVLRAGGTSFDPLYVRVNGESGWFARDLAAYGRAGEPCLRCGRTLVREPFTNRSSTRCPGCQRRPRRPRRA